MVRWPVSRVLSPLKSAGDGHSSRMPVTGHLARPTRAAGPGMKPAGKPVCRPYLVLLPVGFTLPLPLPAARCALTAPFHPYPRTTARRRFAFCGTFPEVTLAGRYPAPYPHGARTFLSRGNDVPWQRPSGHLTRARFRNRGALRQPWPSTKTFRRWSVSESMMPSTRSGRKCR